MNTTYQAPRSRVTAALQSAANNSGTNPIILGDDGSDLGGSDTGGNGAMVTQPMIDGLSRGAFWAMFLAVLSYIGVGLIVLGAVFFVLSGGGLPSIIGAAVMGVIAYIVFRLARFLHLYSKSIKTLKTSYDVYDFIESQVNFKGYTKWNSMLIIIPVVVGIVLAIVGIVLS